MARDITPRQKKFVQEYLRSGDATDAAIAANGVQSRPDKLTGTAAQNKKVFDALVTAVVKERFNALLDELRTENEALRQALAELKPRSAAPQPAPAPEAEASEPQA